MLIIDRMKKSFRAGSATGGLAAVFPILKYIIPKKKAVIENLQEMQNMFRVSKQKLYKNIKIIYLKV